MKKSLGEITQITRYIKNGMYDDTYTVCYGKSNYKRYTIKGEMINKHFDFIMNAKCEEIYKADEKHVGDRFVAV